MGIYDQKFHIRDIRWGWTEEELVENERLVLEEQYVANRDYSDRLRFEFTEEAKQFFLCMPNSLMVQIFMKNFIKRIYRKK